MKIAKNEKRKKMKKNLAGQFRVGILSKQKVLKLRTIILSSKILKSCLNNISRHNRKQEFPFQRTRDGQPKKTCESFHWENLESVSPERMRKFTANQVLTNSTNTIIVSYIRISLSYKTFSLRARKIFRARVFRCDVTMNL